MTCNGFVLQPTYRVEAGRPVVLLWGRLEDGRPFLVRDDRAVPRFYVAAADADGARRLGARRLVPAERLSLEGVPLVAVETSLPAEVPPLRERLQAQGIRCYEADVRFAMRYLMDRGLRSAVEIEGEATVVPELGLVFERPQLGPGTWVPSLRVLSIDIETDPSARRLLSVALAGCGVSEVLLLTPRGWSCPADAVPFAAERELVAALCRRVAELDPDLLTGWSFVDFDLEVLARLARGWGEELSLGRGGGAVSIQAERTFRGSAQAAAPGRVIVDGIELLKGAFVRLDEYGLDFVAREVLGRGKTLTGSERGAEILRQFRHDRQSLVAYNRNDAELVLAILEKLRVVELAVERSRLTGMPVDRVSAAIASFDFLYLSELGARGVAAPCVGDAGVMAEGTGGGHVLEPIPGLYRNALVFDFKSLYPSLIRTFQIDPLGYRPVGKGGADSIVAPNGAAFDRAPGILPAILDDLFPRREAARQAGNNVAAHAIKILMNSFYGVLATPACRFYNPQIANAITSFGRAVLLWSKAWLEAAGLRVLYGDTDSLFVDSGEADAGRARALAGDLTVRLNAALAAHIARTWEVESKLELQFDRLYLWLHLLAVRGGGSGARKRYAGLAETTEGPRPVFTGLESVRRDATELAKSVQRELYARLFSQRPVEGYLREVVRALRAGELDGELVYRKALRKPPEAYTSTTPPHVAAARKLEPVPRRGVVSYVMTLAGPEPAAAREHPLDYEHYVDKQVRPIAEPVLELLGLELARLLGDERQLSLFDEPPA